MLFRKKPITIEAIEFVYTDEGVAALREFVGASIGDIRKDSHMGAKAEAEIVTLEDGNVLRAAHIATEGDWIIKGTAGEYWAVKPNIFWASYEKVNEE